MPTVSSAIGGPAALSPGLRKHVLPAEPSCTIRCCMHINYSFIIDITVRHQSFHHRRAFIAGSVSVTVTIAEAADTGDMPQLNSNDTAGVTPVMPSHSSNYATMDSPTMVTASAAARS